MLGDGLYCEGTSHSLGLCIELFSKLLWETWLFPLIHLQKSSKTESSGLTCPSFQWLPSCSSSFPSYISLHMNTGYMMIWKPFQSYLVTLRRLVGFTQQLKQSKDTWYRFYKEKKKKKIPLCWLALDQVDQDTIVSTCTLGLISCGCRSMRSEPLLLSPRTHLVGEGISSGGAAHENLGIPGCPWLVAQLSGVGKMPTLV